MPEEEDMTTLSLPIGMNQHDPKIADETKDHPSNKNQLDICQHHRYQLPYKVKQL